MDCSVLPLPPDLQEMVASLCAPIVHLRCHDCGCALVVLDQSVPVVRNVPVVFAAATPQILKVEARSHYLVRCCPEPRDTVLAARARVTLRAPSTPDVIWVEGMGYYKNACHSYRVSRPYVCGADSTHRCMRCVNARRE